MMQQSIRIGSVAKRAVPKKTTKSGSPKKETAHKRTGIRRAAKVSRTPDHMVELAAQETYDRFKNFEGKRYTGMKVGAHHKWYYDQGIWREQKVTPDEWIFDYAVKKRRAGKAPKGSGAAVGTEYHWYLLGHQTVRKLNANIYSTAIHGVKYMAAYKKAKTDKWSATDLTQQKKIIRFLNEMTKDLQKEIDREVKRREKEKAEKKEAKKTKRF